jgi:hypothetical protein
LLIRRLLALATVGSLALAAAVILVLPAAPAAAQDVVQDEGSAYRAWHDASQAGDNAKALAAAKDYLARYPTGQYSDFIKKWTGTAQLSALDAAIKEKRTADMIVMGQQILASDPENLNVLYALAFNIRRNELLASPASYQNAPAAVDASRKAIALIESGKTLTGVQSFDKNATLAWLTQVLALNEQKNGTPDQATKLYERSTALAPQDPQVAGRNLLAVLALRQAAYAEAAKAYNAIPDADRAAADTKPEVKAARDKINSEADGLIDVAARFVALAKVKGLPAATRDRVNQALEAVYKTRFPEDASLAGLQKILQQKESSLGTPVAPSGD